MPRLYYKSGLLDFEPQISYNAGVRNAAIKYLSQNQILSAILLVALGWVVVEIREVLVALFVSYILMAAISPYVDFLRKKGVPKYVAVIVPYLFALAFVFLIIISLLPFFIAQIGLFFSRFPVYLNQDVRILGIDIDSSQLNIIAASELENIGRNALALTSKLFGGVFSAISILAVSFYLLLYKDTVRKNFVSLFSKKSQQRVEQTTIQIEERLGGWIRGQIVLSGFIGVLTWLVLTILGVDFALSLAVIAGLLEIIPTIGPIIAAIPAIIVAINSSLFLAIVVAVSYFLIQLFENNVLVPRIMERAVGLNPIVIIIGIIIGGKLLGIPGALLAIPFISLLVVVYKSLE